MLKPFSDPGRAHIVEIFSSLQGEGTRLGERQIFVRFGGCNLHCDYCDEPGAIPIPSGAEWSGEKIEGEILRLNRAQTHRSISWTGGEPLLHVKSLTPLMSWAKAQGFENYLETNGTLPQAFREIEKACDVVAMDLKLRSATDRETWSAHLEFLRAAPERTFVKVILTGSSTEAEWRQVIRLMQEAGPQIPLILQPATAVLDSRDIATRDLKTAPRHVRPIEPARAIAFLRQARGLLKDVRIIPQWHPVWATH